MPLAQGPQTPYGRGVATNAISLPAGTSYIIPNGQYVLRKGPYTTTQYFDPTMQAWRGVGSDGFGSQSPIQFIDADGINFRVVNTTGCALGALITNPGSGYTSPPTVTPSAGGSTWSAIVGGAVSTTVTTTVAGTNYTYPPIVQFSAPPNGGIQATGTCVLSGSGVGTITVVNQGAGYSFPPTVSLINDPRDVTGVNAQAVCTLTGAGTITGLICTNFGTPLTAVPTLTFSPASTTAATVVMDFTITQVNVTNAGAGYTAAAGYVELTGLGGFIPTSGSGVLNPFTGNFIAGYKRAVIMWNVSASGLLTTGTAGGTILDGGRYQAVPTIGVVSGTGLITTAAIATLTVGGATDTVFLTPQ